MPQVSKIAKAYLKKKWTVLRFFVISYHQANIYLFEVNNKNNKALEKGVKYVQS